MKIKEKPNFQNKPKPITLGAKDKIETAIDIMCEKKVGSIIIINKKEEVIGIITERDMLTRVLAAGIDIKKTEISEIMTSNIKIANENDSLIDWVQTMSNERFRHLPVVNNEGKLVNMLSQGDFVAFTWPGLYEKFKQDLKGRLGKSLQILLVIFTLLTLLLIAFGL